MGHLAALAILAALIALALAVPPARAKLPALRVSENGRFLVTEDGKPFFWLGDTVWKLLYWPTFDELDFYLADREAKGFNVLQCIAVNPWGRPNVEGEYAFIDDDILKPNEKFWDRADRIIRRCNRRGFYVAITIAWRHVVVYKPMITRENARQWGRWIASRYKDCDVVWVLGGDQPVIDNIDFWDLMAQGVRDADQQHLITYHPMGHQSSATWLHGRRWLDFNMLQTGHARDWPCWKLVADAWGRRPPKPVVDGEPPYEHIGNNLQKDALKRGDVITAWDVRKALYWDVFAGAAGVTYGCNEVYRFWVPGRPGRPWGESIPWQQALKLPGSGQVQHLKNLVLSRPYLSRIPDQSLVAGGQRDGAGHVQATRDSNGSYAMIYIPDGHKVAIDLSKLSGKKLVAWWFKPRDGKVYGQDGAASGRPFVSFGRLDGPMEFQPPTGGEREDWVLVIDDAAAGFGLPGQPAR